MHLGISYHSSAQLFIACSQPKLLYSCSESQCNQGHATFSTQGSPRYTCGSSQPYRTRQTHKQTKGSRLASSFTLVCCPSLLCVMRKQLGGPITSVFVKDIQSFEKQDDHGEKGDTANLSQLAGRAIVHTNAISLNSESIGMHSTTSV